MAFRFLLLFVVVLAVTQLTMDSTEAVSAADIQSNGTTAGQSVQTTSSKAPTMEASPDQNESERKVQRKILIGFMVTLLGIAGWYILRKRAGSLS